MMWHYFDSFQHDPHRAGVHSLFWHDSSLSTMDFENYSRSRMWFGLRWHDCGWRQRKLEDSLQQWLLLVSNCTVDVNVKEEDCDLPTKPSIPAHNPSQVVLTSPLPAVASKETHRMMAKIIVITPTLKAKPTPIFSIRDICKFQRSRMGMNMTVVYQ
jgi:hypothetical protein